MSKDEKIETDFGTTELSKRFKIVPKLTRGSYGLNGKVMDETEIDRLLLEDRIDPNEHSTLEMFLARLHKIGYIGLKSPSYDSPIHADPSGVGDKKANAVRGIIKLMAGLDRSVGNEKRRALINLVTQDEKFPYPDAELKQCIRSLMELM